ncbi:MAG: tetratricopeptide repeat protein [Chthoniobacterales bacterium]
MKFRKFAAISLLVLSSFAANSVAPSKTELESMYDKAFREFDGNDYAAALKDLDAIDAREPDLAESQNLRGVIMMRQKDYPTAEAALKKALAADPKFWNARFNLAEIPFLQKNWPEGRKRFQELLNSNASELQGEATQLIQYKIMLTYLLEGKENMVTSMLAKFELAPDAPAVHYANAALALNKKDDAGAKEWLTKAEKNFSPQLNKLFAESLYEVGWLEKPVGQTRAALELNSAADRAAQTKAFADAKYDQAEQALAQRDLTAARKLVDEADNAQPNQPRVYNLRGEIMLEQKDYDQAENEFRKALKVDSKSRDAQYNLAQVPFKKKEYAKARDRFESLFSVTTGADKDQAAQLIKFKIFLTFLLEGKDARAQKMMEQFQFTGDTPALYYAQAAMEFKNNNAAKATEWVTSARKIYSPALNGVFSEAFFDLGWIRSPAQASPALMVAENEQQPETAPAIEPTPIPAITLAQTTPAPVADPLTLAANSAVSGMEASTSSQLPAASTTIASGANANAPAGASPSVETPVASTASPAAARPVVAVASEPDAGAKEPVTASAAASTTPATVLAPAQVREWSQPSLSDRLNDRNTLLVGGLLLAGILLLAWVVIAEIRRRMSRAPRSHLASSSVVAEEGVGAVEHFIRPTAVAGGPPQVSLQLRASEPAVRRGATPIGRSGRSASSGTAVVGDASVAVPDQPETAAFMPAVAESFDEGVGEPIGGAADSMITVAPEPSQAEFVPEQSFTPDNSFTAEQTVVAEPSFATEPSFAAPLFEAPIEEQTTAFQETITEEPTQFIEPASFEAAPAVDESLSQVPEPAVEAWQQPAALAEPPAATLEAPVEAFVAPEPVDAETNQPEAIAAPEFETAQPVVAAVPEFAAESIEETHEPIGQGQPVPYLVAASEAAVPTAEVPPAPPEPPRSRPASLLAAGLAGIGALRHSVANSASSPRTTINEPTAQQPTTPAIMPQPTQPNPAPVIRTGPPTGAPQQQQAPQEQPAAAMQQPMAQPTTSQPAGGGGMHTAVQLTFSFEIASLQLTPTFKMGALQLKPTSKIVTMRLAPSQHPQPAMNLQVTFEIATVQLNGNAIGQLRLTPSQQQRPGISSSPSFGIAGLQLVAGSDAAPVQLTATQQGQASVLVTAGFQIATVEFSPSFEIASIVLNATSRNVNVQLPGNGPSAVEGAPVFEIANVQLSGNGEIGMMQLTAPGGAKRA